MPPFCWYLPWIWDGNGYISYRFGPHQLVSVLTANYLLSGKKNPIPLKFIEGKLIRLLIDVASMCFSIVIALNTKQRRIKCHLKRDLHKIKYLRFNFLLHIHSSSFTYPFLFVNKQRRQFQRCMAMAV